MVPPSVTDVPSDQVGSVVQDFIDFDDVVELKVDKQSNGKFTITPVR